jgi:hypothetical protein
MARISKADHPRILHLADIEGRKAPDIAADYGCTPANIYTLLAKLRRAAPATEIQAPQPPDPAPVTKPPADLFAAPTAPVPPPRPPAPESRSATVTDIPPRKAPDRGGVGAKLAKPGYGLAMRTAEGEESLAPFRSLDDLLTAIKPILRGAARSPDPVWFSIQPIDLALIDSDAA